MAVDHEDIMGIEELSAYLKVSTGVLYKLAREGRLPCHKVGRQWRFRREEIDRWMAAPDPGSASKRAGAGPVSRAAARKGDTSRGKETKNIGRSTNSVGHMGFAGIFASPALVRLLTVFALHADKEFYQKELADRVEARLYTVQRELARLERAGLVFRIPRGNRVYYQADRRHPAFEDLKRVVVKTVGLGDAVRTALEPVAERVRVAFIYGSFARGEETPESDIDLFVVGDISLGKASRVLGPAGRSLGREFNLVVYPPDELRRKAEGNHPFVEDVLKGEKIYIVGDEDELERIVGGGTSPAA